VVRTTPNISRAYGLILAFVVLYCSSRFGRVEPHRTCLSTARKRIRPQALMSSVGSKHTELRHIVNLLLWATVRFASFTIVQGARFVSFLFISLPISIPAFTCLCKVREACDLFGRHLASANEIIISWLKWRSRWQLHPLTLGVERELENTVKAGGQNGELWKNPILFLPEQKVNGLKCGKWH